MYLSFSAWLSKPVHGYVCQLTKQWDESEHRERWSMPALDRCMCQAVVKMKKRDKVCPSVQEKEAIDLWFTDRPGPLTDRANWKPEPLNRLLERAGFCCKFIIFD